MSLDPTELFFETIDGVVEKILPDGIDKEPDGTFTTVAFDYYLTKYSFPKTANELRRLFEFAAILDRTMQFLVDQVVRPEKEQK